ncbi:low molecular weight protein-tyrosine-phosphatase [Spongorhabdus nitratireducens]
MKKRILFVCLGNICRSPAAEGVFREKARRAGLLDQLEIDSAGTGAWHEGEAPDRRMQKAARARGYDLSPLRARQTTADDFSGFDYIFAMNRENLANLKQQAPADCQDRISLFLALAPELDISEVPDPYYGGAQGFDQVLDLVESASDQLILQLQESK